MNTGTDSVSSPGVFKFIATGASESHPAVANVSVLGTAVAKIEAAVGANHNTFITVQH